MPAEMDCHGSQRKMLQDEQGKALLGQEDKVVVRRREAGYLRIFAQNLMGAMFFISYVLLLFSYIRAVNKPMGSGLCVNGLEGKRHPRTSYLERQHAHFKPLNAGIYSDAPLQSYRRVFKQSGFHNPNKPDKPTEYEGEPNPDNEAAWNRAMSGG